MRAHRTPITAAHPTLARAARPDNPQCPSCCWQGDTRLALPDDLAISILLTLPLQLISQTVVGGGSRGTAALRLAAAWLAALETD